MERGDLAPLWMAGGSGGRERRERREVGRLKSPFRSRGCGAGMAGAAASVAAVLRASCGSGLPGRGGVSPPGSRSARIVTCAEGHGSLVRALSNRGWPRPIPSRTGAGGSHATRQAGDRAGRMFRGCCVCPIARCNTSRACHESGCRDSGLPLSGGA